MYVLIIACNSFWAQKQFLRCSKAFWLWFSPFILWNERLHYFWKYFLIFCRRDMHTNLFAFEKQIQMCCCCCQFSLPHSLQQFIGNDVRYTFSYFRIKINHCVLSKKTSNIQISVKLDISIYLTAPPRINIKKNFCYSSHILTSNDPYEK